MTEVHSVLAAGIAVALILGFAVVVGAIGGWIEASCSQAGEEERE